MIASDSTPAANVASVAEIVSVVIAAYNVEPFIARAMESVMAQTYTDWEMIVVDDASTDGTLAVARKVASRDKRVVVVSLRENQGAGCARNAGVERASGRYLAFLDADDEWADVKLERQLAFMKARECTVAYTSYALVDLVTKRQCGAVHARSSLNLGQFMRTTNIGLSTAMIDRQRCGDVRFAPIRMRQDALLWMTLLSQGHRACGMPETLVRYTVRPGQVSGNKVRAAWVTWLLYFRFKEIPVWQRTINFVFYAVSAVWKRI